MQKTRRWPFKLSMRRQFPLSPSLCAPVSSLFARPRSPFPFSHPRFSPFPDFSLSCPFLSTLSDTASVCKSPEEEPLVIADTLHLIGAIVTTKMTADGPTGSYE